VRWIIGNPLIAITMLRQLLLTASGVKRISAAAESKKRQ
jgi:hypothetical protein